MVSNQQYNFRRLTFCFGLFSTIAALLVGLGQNSWYLPALVICCSTAAYFLTDRTGVFVLPRYVVYAGMILGALLAGYEFVTNMNPDRLLWVGNLLVYVQLPLYFQKKETRVFEQWGVFLLLELVVAALVNDNVLYGILMLPVLAVGSAALMALAQYVSYQRHNEALTESTNWFARAVHWLGREKTPTVRASGLEFRASQSASLVSSQSYMPVSWWKSILPFATAMLVFSIGFFYMLPRLYSETWEGEGLGWGGNRVGFSDQISFSTIGKILQNDAPAFRMTLTNELTGKTYRPNQPPYIRGTVVHRYIDGPGQGSWQPGDRYNYQRRSLPFRELHVPKELDTDLLVRRDAVRVHVAERSPFGDVVCSLPPYAQTEKNPFRTARRDWRMIDTRPEAVSDRPPKRRYSFLTYAFLVGQETPVLEDQSDVYEDKQPSTLSTYGEEITLFPQALEVMRPEIERVLGTSKLPLNSRLSKALFLEDYLANSGAYDYTLTLTGPRDPGIDPIADFVLNKKRGHCQYFASALALMLRSMNVPTRLVIGFRPSEYNDLGGYFQVSQNHAHVWVEAYFTANEIREAEDSVRASVLLPPWVTRGIWLRLDPTPPVNGSNAGGTLKVSSTQTLDAMQDLWNEMVINMDKSKQGGLFSLFGESSEGSYANFYLQLQSLLTRMQDSRFVGGFLSPDRWFSWRVAVGVFLSGLLLFGAWKILPSLMPTWMQRKLRATGLQRQRVRSRIEFYEKVSKQLRRLGFQRAVSQTPQEYLGWVDSTIKRVGLQLDMPVISEAFYAKRFGEKQELSPEQQTVIESVVQRLDEVLGNSELRSGIKAQIKQAM